MTTKRRVVQFMLLPKGGRVVVMLGAGASVSAGIPDFRSPGSGLYANLEAAYPDLPYPEAIFELEFFKKDQGPFYSFARELLAEQQPTPMHFFCRLLHEKKRLVRCYTQNIDSLETRAGLPARMVVAAHGNCDTASCVGSGEPVDPLRVREALLSEEVPLKAMAALNAEVGDLIKNDIVFFGESMPARFFSTMEADFKEADLLIVAGTSLSVLPFAALIALTRPNATRVLINLERVGDGDELVFQNMITGALEPGFDFNSTRDVFIQTTTDDAAWRLSTALGWRLEEAAGPAGAPPPPPGPPNS